MQVGPGPQHDLKVEAEGRRPPTIGTGQGWGPGRRNVLLVEVGGGNACWRQRMATDIQLCTGRLPGAQKQIHGCGEGRVHTQRAATQRRKLTVMGPEAQRRVNGRGVAWERKVDIAGGNTNSKMRWVRARSANNALISKARLGTNV